MGNERITILVTVKDRWCDNDEYDQYGELIRWPNPDPTIVWNSGCWNREDGQGVMMTMPASKFREITGVIMYGGSIEKRGVHKLSILFGNYTRLKAHRSGEVVVKRGRKKAVKAKQTRVLPPKRNKLNEVKSGQGRQLKGMMCRVRKRT